MGSWSQGIYYLYWKLYLRASFVYFSSCMYQFLLSFVALYQSFYHIYFKIWYRLFSIHLSMSRFLQWCINLEGWSSSARIVGRPSWNQLLPGCVGVPSRGRSPSSTADRCCNTAAFLVHLNLWVIGHIMIILEGRHRDVGICIFQAGFWLSGITLWSHFTQGRHLCIIFYLVVFRYVITIVVNWKFRTICNLDEILSTLWFLRVEC